MQRVALIYNPISGRHPGRRAALLERVAVVFREAAMEVAVVPTDSADSVLAQTRRAIDEGYDTLVACGGDGTVHGVMQGVVGTSVALGVIPMGTANALANDLGLAGSPERAARMLLGAMPLRIPVGRVGYRTFEGVACSAYFVVAAGVGADALFFSRLDSRLKQRWGYAHYLVEVFRLWAKHTFPTFRATLLEAGSSATRVEEVSQLLAVRIGNFGGLVGRLVDGASRHDDVLQVVAIKTRSRWRLLRWIAAVCLRRHTFADPIERLECESVECDDPEEMRERTLVEADGELLGTLPARIEIVPAALMLLVPRLRGDGYQWTKKADAATARPVIPSVRPSRK